MNVNPFAPHTPKGAYHRAAIVIDGKLTIMDMHTPQEAQHWLAMKRIAHGIPETMGQVFEVWH